jgi:hypothetical protein
MNIESYIVTIDDCEEHLVESIGKLLHVDKDTAIEVYTNSLYWHISQLKKTISILVEAPYVDRVYRNSYYNYFSSKFSEYPRDSVKLSFFEGEISNLDFSNGSDCIDLRDRYRGFMILRPTIKNIIGRNVISPLALINREFIICSANFHSTVNSVKFEVEGFPHSSQDSETITCAETSIWAIMEYFGNKYPDYKPVLPSKIIEVLRMVSIERQIPSRGLRIDQISYALREFGFGTRLYSKEKFGELEFKRLFSCYIESGIPLIVAVQGNSIGHAILCIGHNKVTPDMVDNLTESMTESKTESMTDKVKIAPEDIDYYDNDDIEKKFVFIDDNMPVCQQLLYKCPTGGYSSRKDCDPDWGNCKITHFIAPLYPKIYLEAYEAKKFCRQFIFENFNNSNGKEIYLRFFLTSGRSFKNVINFNNTFDADNKQLLLETPLPKFIWVGEITNKQLIKNREANGIIVLDATEADTSELKPLLFANYLNELFSIDPGKTIFSKKILPLRKFSIFTSNLK